MFDFGLRLKELRLKHHLSQEELGKRVDRSKSVICSYENNLKLPPLHILIDMAHLFHVSLDYLVGIDKETMISIEGLSEPQRRLIQTIVFELTEGSKTSDGLSDRQQQILSGLMKEFSKQ